MGINYGQGQVVNNLLSPPQVASLRIGKVRIYDVNWQVNSGIQLIVTVPDDLVPSMAASQSQVLQWLTASVRPYFPAMRVTGVAVGNDNEVFTPSRATTRSSRPASRTPMRNLQGNDSYVHVSTANSRAVLQTSSLVVMLLEISPATTKGGSG